MFFFCFFLLLFLFVKCGGHFRPTWTLHSAGPQAAGCWFGWGYPWPVSPRHSGVPINWSTAARRPTAALRLSWLRPIPGRCYRCCCYCRPRCCCCSSGASGRSDGRLRTRPRPFSSDWCLEWPASWLFHQAAGPVQKSDWLPLHRRTLPVWWCFPARTWVDMTEKEKHLAEPTPLTFGETLSRRHTCAGTSELLQLHLWSCSAPQRSPVSGWGGTWWGGRAACTVYVESNRQSGTQTQHLVKRKLHFEGRVADCTTVTWGVRFLRTSMLLVLEELSVLHVVPAMEHENTSKLKILRNDFKQVDIAIISFGLQTYCLQNKINVQSNSSHHNWLNYYIILFYW